MKQMELSYTAGGDAKWNTDFGKQNWQLLTLYLAYDPETPLPHI